LNRLKAESFNGVPCGAPFVFEATLDVKQPARANAPHRDGPECRAALCSLFLFPFPQRGRSAEKASKSSIIVRAVSPEPASLDEKDAGSPLATLRGLFSFWELLRTYSGGLSNHRLSAGHARDNRNVVPAPMNPTQL
jgi:hypothetical protein